jgi:hypothetical protein
MKLKNIIGFACATSLALTAFAFNLPIPEGQEKRVLILADGKPVAELRVLDTTADFEIDPDATIELGPKTRATRVDPSNNNVSHMVNGGWKLKVLAHGRSVLSMSADSMHIGTLKAEIPK